MYLTDYRRERSRAMRAARNAAFYRDLAGLDPLRAAIWTDYVRESVRTARTANRAYLARLRQVLGYPAGSRAIRA